MPKFVFAYHGGKMPETPEEGAQAMARWTDWFASMGEAVVDGGNPVGPSKTVTATGIEDNGGANPISGYSLINVQSIDEAVALAKTCPILPEGTIEIAETFEL